MSAAASSRLSPSAPVSASAPVGVAGVVLDLGNVLIDWDPFDAVAAGVGRQQARAFLEAEDFDFHAWNHGPDSGMSWLDAEAAVSRSHPHWLPHAEAYRAHFVASLRGEVPGTADVVRELHAADVPLWGLTNWSAELYPHAPDRFDVLALLRDVVVSGVEGVAKPDPRVFAVLASRVDLPLEQLVLVDDREANVAAARAAGMDGIVFTGAPALRAALVERGLLA